VSGDVALDTELKDSEKIPEITKGVFVKTLFLPSSLDQRFGDDTVILHRMFHRDQRAKQNRKTLWINDDHVLEFWMRITQDHTPRVKPLGHVFTLLGINVKVVCEFQKLCPRDDRG
jgi:hypothetical protein